MSTQMFVPGVIYHILDDRGRRTGGYQVLPNTGVNAGVMQFFTGHSIRVAAPLSPPSAPLPNLVMKAVAGENRITGLPANARQTLYAKYWSSNGGEVDCPKCDRTIRVTNGVGSIVHCDWCNIRIEATRT